MAEIDFPSIKKSLVESLISKLSEQIELTKKSLKEKMAEINEAPGIMQSKSDTNGIQGGWLLEATTPRLAEMLAWVMALQQLKFTDSGLAEVRLGSLVKCQREASGKTAYYLVLPVAGGEMIDNTILKSKVTVITPAAPVTQAILGKKVGENGKVNNNDFVITDIY